MLQSGTYYFINFSLSSSNAQNMRKHEMEILNRIVELYEMLYLEKYSKINPQSRVKSRATKVFHCTPQELHKYPAEFHDIQEYSKRKHEKRREKVEDGLMSEAQSEKEPIVLFICKPESGSQGRGIFIASKVEEMRL